MENPLFCAVCDVKLSDPAASVAHFIGKRHKKAAAKALESALDSSKPVAEGDDAPATDTPTADAEEADKQRRVEKAKRKRNAKKEREVAESKAMAEEAARSRAEGPTQRERELDAVTKKLSSLSLTMSPIPSDGNCLYGSIAHQILNSGRLIAGLDAEDSTVPLVKRLRRITAKEMLSHASTYMPFVEGVSDAAAFAKHCDGVRDSAMWGSEVELRALSHALRIKVIVHSATASPVTVGDAFPDEPLHIVYLLHYCSSGEHYNSTVSKSSPDYSSASLARV